MPTQGQLPASDGHATNCPGELLGHGMPTGNIHDVSMLDTTESSLNTSSLQKPIPAEIQETTRDIPTPVSSVDESYHGHVAHGPSSPEPHVHHHRTDVLGDPFPLVRFLPNSSSSYLKPGARFTGVQSSDTQRYEVTVDLQHVDMESSFLCGYLKIRGLTDQHPTLTTYFEGEMIGSKYSFVTNHSDWVPNEKVDFQHWARFQAWRPYAKDARRSNYKVRNWPQKECIWMRWKEHFLVPDHKVKDLAGASFDGFYYICFNQKEGTIQGTYYHARSDK